MSTDPEQIRREIETTRNSLSDDVDALAYKVNPGRVIEDRKQRARNAVREVRDRAMGTSSSATSSIGDVASRAPEKLREKSEGNPLAAGLIAFGVGWLASSLLPASGREQRIAEQVRRSASEHGDSVREKVGEVAYEVREGLREPTHQAVDSVRRTASEAAQVVRPDGQATMYDVRDHPGDRIAP